jgi:hypothetical protein
MKNLLVAVFGTIAGACLFIIGMFLIHALIIYLLWNWLSPAIFDGPTITYLQSMGISLVMAICRSIIIKNK